MDGLEAFVARLPKVELHVHLVGSAPVPAVLELARRHPDSRVPRTEEKLRQFYAFRDFPHFAEVYAMVNDLLSGPEDIADLVRGIAADLAGQNVRYVEIKVSPSRFVLNGMPPAAITEALDVAAADGLSRHGIRIGYLFEFPGEHAGEQARLTLDHALSQPPDALTGFGIAGIEQSRALHRDLIRDVFGAAAAAGLHCVPHAGEMTGPETVWEAVGQLHAERIGHGINSMRDPRLVAHLAERQLPLEVCPTSNVCTGQVAGLGEHPLPLMLEAGLNVTLNSDDPPMFSTTLSNEYLVAGRVFGLSRPRLAELAANAVRASFLDDPAKEALISEITQASDGAGSAQPLS